MIGKKAENLQKLRDIYPESVPDFEVIPFHKVIKDHKTLINKISKEIKAFLNDDTNHKQLKDKIDLINRSIELNEVIVEDFYNNISLKKWKNVSYRTSALLEDTQQASFAGQYESYVDEKFTSDNLQKKILACFKSLYSLRVIAYCAARGINVVDIGGSIVVQDMFYGKRSGVLFTENGNGEIIFAYTDSWQNLTVEGANSNELSISKLEIENIKSKELRDIAHKAIYLEKLEGTPLDIEWSHTSGKIALLQMRPITTLNLNQSIVWDATNISENYPGITLPLTYSFIRNLYSKVYPSFFSLMGISSKTLERKSYIFDNTLGYIKGRVYYRINNWYEIVKLIPGKNNQVFFEEMLRPVERRSESQQKLAKYKLLNPVGIVLTVRFIWLLTTSGIRSNIFSKKFRSEKAKLERLNWNKMKPGHALSHLQTIERDLLALWSIPILNDIKVMIFHGILKTYIYKDKSPEDYLESLRGLTQQNSIAPLRSLRDAGKSIDELIKKEDVSSVQDLKDTGSWQAALSLAENYARDFGGRSPDELKLENPRLHEELEALIELSWRSKDGVIDPQTQKMSAPVVRSLPLHKRILANFVFKHTKDAIDNRETFRLNRAEVFGIARRAYLAIGKKFVDEGLIKDVNDIFWLYNTEIDSVINGHSWSYDLKTTVQSRRKRFSEYENEYFSLRVEGNSLVPATSTIYKSPEIQDGSRNLLNGLGVSEGKLTTEAIVVDKFDPNIDVSGKILVARHLDPGWTLLLVQASGVITEQGNALSHVSIVSREINIPAVVNVNKATSMIKSGQKITIDGSKGVIKLD